VGGEAGAFGGEGDGKIESLWLFYILLLTVLAISFGVRFVDLFSLIEGLP